MRVREKTVVLFFASVEMSFGPRPQRYLSRFPFFALE